MNSVVVGAGDCQVCSDPQSVLVTHALGSCMAVSLHDAQVGVGGLLHFALPDAGSDGTKAEANPFLYADTGVPLMFHRAYELGADKRRLVVTVAGGAQSEGAFNAGKRNYMALRKILWKAGVIVQAEEVGGTVSRTIRLEVDSGRVTLHRPDSSEHELAAGSPLRTMAS